MPLQIKYNDNIPAPPAGKTNVKWQEDGDGNRSAYIDSAPSGSAGGDLTGSYPNPTIGDDAVTYDKMQDTAAGAILLGRGDHSPGGGGEIEEITLGTGLSMSGTTLNASSSGGGSVSKSHSGFRLTLASGYPVYTPRPATPTSTDTGADTVTFSTAPGWETGTLVTVSANGGGLVVTNLYFLHKVSGTVYSFHSTVANANSGSSPINLTASITAQIIPSGISGTTLYFSPFTDNEISLYSGSSWSSLTSAEVSIALGTLTSDKNYDVFAYDNAGTLTLELLAWTSDTVRATAVVRQDGVWVKSGATTRRLVGTIRTDSTTTTTDDAAGTVGNIVGKRFVSNVDNRRPAYISEFEATASWNYGTVTIRQARGNAANQVEVVSCLGEAAIDLTLTVLETNPTNATGIVSIGEDSTTAMALEAFSAGGTQNAAAAMDTAALATLRKIVPAGWHKYVWLETVTAAHNVTFYGIDTANLRRHGLSGFMEC
jgi:Repeat of unknown function (DUF5907)